MDSVSLPQDSEHQRQERIDMVRAQIQERGISDEHVLVAMCHVPRHFFVPPDSIIHAYEDRPLSIGFGQTISQPYMVALMTELLRLQPSFRVLEIGSGSGYQTAVLAELAQEVVTIEREKHLAAQAQDRLKRLGYTNITVLAGDGTLGCPERAPFDAILVTAGGPDVPHALREQLADGGHLVCPVGPRDLQRLKVVTRTQETFEEHYDTACVFVPLIGAEGWPE